MSVNIKHDAKAKTIIVTMAYDPAKTYPASKTGKNAMVASTSGFIAVPGTDVRLSLNAIAPLKG